MPAKIGQNTHIVIWGGIVERWGILWDSNYVRLCTLQDLWIFINFLFILPLVNQKFLEQFSYHPRQSFLFLRVSQPSGWHAKET